MIIKYIWEKKVVAGAIVLRRYVYEGWFLLGFIPLYIKKSIVH